ncbi:I-set domain containing protein [Trichuris trichiura]|uniref:I-set domain containing protein n=1 Tax=Trichuris trichiura TaxID=36087 RepID=A0A077ZBG7_TRITR|nr:I-set domain containing protein [Trichuris trichiura]
MGELGVSTILSLPGILCQLFNTCAKYQTPHFGKPMKDVTAQPGDNVSFTCHVKNLGRYLVAFVRTEPTMLISWQHKMFASKRNKYSLENNGEAWILWINNVDGSDEGIYMCQINTNPMVAQIASLTVQKPPKINKKSTTHDIIVKEGSNATLTCVADGSPKPIVSWRRKDNGIIVTNEPEGYGESVVYKNNLVLYKLSRQHMGEYICLATNGIQPEESWSVKIQVHFGPKLLPSSNPIYASIGSKVELICTGEAWPRPTFSWSINEKIILPETSKFEMTTRSSSKNPYHSQGVLIINKLSSEDFGTYRCKAENEYGTETIEIELRGKPFAQPICHFELYIQWRYLQRNSFNRLSNIPKWKKQAKLKLQCLLQLNRKSNWFQHPASSWDLKFPHLRRLHEIGRPASFLCGLSRCLL